MNIRIYYEDTDAGGIVYHTNYIKYCERARSELFFEKGLDLTDGEKSGFVVRKIEADFLGMAMLGEMIKVKSKVLTRKSTSLLLEQSIYKDEEKIFSMNILLVFVRKGRPSRIPEHMFEVLI